MFLKAAGDAGFMVDLFPDTDGFALHILRHDNIAQCFPQYRLPEFLLTRIFGPKVLAMASR